MITLVLNNLIVDKAACLLTLHLSVVVVVVEVVVVVAACSSSRYYAPCLLTQHLVLL